MKPWKLCVNKQKSYKIDIRDLISDHNFIPFLNNLNLNYFKCDLVNYDFVNKKYLTTKFVCRFETVRNKDKDKDKNKDKDK